MNTVGAIDGGAAFTSPDELRRFVEERRGVATVSMRAVKAAFGRSKLGPHVVKELSGGLQSLGLAHQPPVLPVSQDDEVRLYQAGGPVAVLVEAAQKLGSDHDEKLRLAAAQDAAQDAAAKLQRVRAIVM